MLIDAVLLWKYKLKYGDTVHINKGLNKYSKIAFSWWMVAFLTGMMVAINSR